MAGVTKDSCGMCGIAGSAVSVTLIPPKNCHPVSNNNGAVKGREERGRLEPNSSAISLLLRTALAHAKNQDSRFALHQGGGSCWLHQPSLRFRPPPRNHDFTRELPHSSGRHAAHSTAQSFPAPTARLTLPLTPTATHAH